MYNASNIICILNPLKNAKKQTILNEDDEHVMVNTGKICLNIINIQVYTLK